jgi:Flp pilus assembly pilin Flp
MLLDLYVHLHTALLGLGGQVADHVAGVRHRRDEHGQATAEYALVLLGAAAIAMIIATWATKSGLIGKLLDTVLDKLVGKADKAA